MIDELPAAPDPATDSPAEFSAKAAASVLAQKRMVEQFNASVAGFNALLSGGAYAFPYIFSSVTGNVTPPPGRIAFDTATQNAATAMRTHWLTESGVDVDALYAALAAGTSAIKGAVRLVKASDPSKWLLFDITAVSSRSTPTNARNIFLSPLASSDPAPFANGDKVLAYFDRHGDRGNGSLAMQYLAGTTIASPVLNIDYLNIFTSEFDKYIIELTGFAASAIDTLQLRGAVAGVLTTGNGYYGPGVDGATLTSQTQFAFGSVHTSSSFGANYTIEVRNNPSGQKGFGVRGFGYSTSSGIIREGMVAGVGTFSGFRLTTATAGVNITNGTIAIYGVRKTNL